jgi:hypothetical protein
MPYKGTLMRDTVHILVLAFVVSGPTVVKAQLVERPRTFASGSTGVATSANDVPQLELLQNATVDVGPAIPRLRLKVVKLYALVGRKWLPIYVLTNLSALLPQGSDSARLTARELLSQLGGLANLGISWEVDSLRVLGHSLLCPCVRGKQGLVADIRFGARAIEYLVNGTRHIGPTAMLGTNLDLLIPLANQADMNTQAGLLTLNLRGTLNYAGGAAFDSTFKQVDGTTAAHFYGAVAFDASFNVFDQFYLSGGYNFSMDKRIPSTGFFGMSLSRRN